MSCACIEKNCPQLTDRSSLVAESTRQLKMAHGLHTAEASSLPEVVREDHMAASGATLTATFRHRRRQKRTESGLSERQFEFKSFTVIAARNRTGSRRNIADRGRTGRARRNPAKFFRMWWPGTELNRRRQPFQSGVDECLEQLNRS